MLIFIDESYQKDSTTDDVHYTTYSAACMPISASRDFSRELFNLKRAFWSISEPTEKELKGQRLLTRRSLEKPKNREYVDNILSLIRTSGFTLFAMTSKGPLGTFKSREYLQKPFQYFLERINEYVKSVDSELMGLLIYDSIEDKANAIISESVTNFLYRHAVGQKCENIVDFPTFGDSKTTPGLQIADIVAYCINARKSGSRPRLEPIYRQMEKLTINIEDAGFTRYGFRFIDQTRTAQ